MAAPIGAWSKACSEFLFAFPESSFRVFSGGSINLQTFDISEFFRLSPRTSRAASVIQLILPSLQN